MFTVHTQTPKPCELTERDIYALKFIHRHTMVASNILYELMRETKGTKDRTNYVDWLRRLYDGKWLERPESQRFTEQPNGNFHIYRLTPAAEKVIAREVVKHSGQFPHQLMGATFTATIDIMCRRAGYTFIPADELLGDVKKKLEVPFRWTDGTIVNGKYAIFDPDYLYAIKYHKGLTIAYLPEFNRSTEPEITPSYVRRSDIKTLRQMAELIGEENYKALFGFKHQLVFQFITVSDLHARNFIEMADRELNRPNYITASYMPTFASPFKPPAFPSYLFDDPWLATRKGTFTIKKTAP